MSRARAPVEPPGDGPRTRTFSRAEVEAILALMGDEVRVLTASWDGDDLGGGGDVDCAIRGADPMWPLRLDAGIRLCQRLEYDVHAGYWVLERGGAVLAIDAIDDPRGLGRYTFPTAELFETDGLVPAPAARAAYLTVKRLRKGERAEGRWRSVRDLARAGRGVEPSFERLVVGILGGRLGGEAVAATMAGSVPSATLADRARRRMLLRRLASPAVPLELGRILSRLRRPTGLLVVVTGPDGAGKSTMAAALPEECRGLFRRHARFHWRPGVLPDPRRLVGAAPGDPADPHGRPSHPRPLSLARLLYFWADFALGAWARWSVLRARSGLVVVERGWWDLLVDPRRYRLDVAPQVVRTLGRLLPRADLVLVCDSPVDALTGRSDELPRPEVERQALAWRKMADRLPEARLVDGREGPDAAVGRARERVVEALEARAIGRLGHGWTGWPRAVAPRWTLPRGPAAAARAALDLYQPTSPARWAAWQAARAMAAVGAGRLLPRGEPPPRLVRALLAPLMPRRGTLAVARANHRGRFFALVLGEDGRPRLFVKVATDDRGAEALEREAASLHDVAERLEGPVRPPEVIERRRGVLALRAERWRPRVRPWRLDEDVAAAAGALFRSGSIADRRGVPIGPGHGDLAPWNLLRTDTGWVLVDWEHAGEDLPVFYDVFHHLVQSHALLGRPGRDSVLEAVHGRGPAGAAMRAYADAAGADLAAAPAAFRAYLGRSAAGLDRDAVDARMGLRARRELAGHPALAR